MLVLAIIVHMPKYAQMGASTCPRSMGCSGVRPAMIFSQYKETTIHRRLHRRLQGAAARRRGSLRRASPARPQRT